VTTSVNDPRESSFGRDYWLRRCHGFLVESSAGRVGVVKETLYGPTMEPEQLVVGAGLLGRRDLLVPVTAVVEILPRERRIVVATREIGAG
jgi:hypothetical protein